MTDLQRQEYQYMKRARQEHIPADEVEQYLIRLHRAAAKYAQTHVATVTKARKPRKGRPRRTHPAAPVYPKARM
jgi:hypothetical protein